jgi:hypothetical protein
VKNGYQKGSRIGAGSSRATCSVYVKKNACAVQRANLSYLGCKGLSHK